MIRHPVELSCSMRRAPGGRCTLSCIVLKKKLQVLPTCSAGGNPPGQVICASEPHTLRANFRQTMTLAPATRDHDCSPLVPLVTSTNKNFVPWQWSRRSSLSQLSKVARWWQGPGTRHLALSPSSVSSPVMLQEYIYCTVIRLSNQGPHLGRRELAQG